MAAASCGQKANSLLILFSTLYTIMSKRTQNSWILHKGIGQRLVTGLHCSQHMTEVIRTLLVSTDMNGHCYYERTVHVNCKH